MTVVMNIDYQGQLSCSATHGPSQNRIETDAPKDNAGRGLSFSPTDLVATALASCALTTVAIKAPKEGIEIDGASARVEKHMGGPPRRIAKLVGDVRFYGRYSDEARARLEDIAKSCPVALTLHPNTEVVYSFKYD